MADKKTVKKRKVKKNIPVGVVKVKATFNNTIITISDTLGNVISWSTAGAMGFKGSKKSTPFAAQLAASEAAKKAKDCGINSVSVYVNGPGGGRESAIRAIHAEGIKVTFIKDVTPVPFNGCRPKKRRRI
jgi:small subunit ribosomal protein S11